MPSFDVVSEFDLHEVTNSVDQANREVANRFDFKGTGAKYALEGTDINLEAEADFQLRQMLDILTDKLSRRGIDVACMKVHEPELVGNRARQRVELRKGIDKELAKRLVKTVKDTKIKVQAAVQGEQVRITGKKRDDLQQVIAVLKGGDFDLPLQFTNFRD